MGLVSELKVSLDAADLPTSTRATQELALALAEHLDSVLEGGGSPPVGATQTYLRCLESLGLIVSSKARVDEYKNRKPEDQVGSIAYLRKHRQGTKGAL